MDMNSLYNYSTSFEDLRVRSYSLPYSVNCSASGFESKSYASSVNVIINSTILSLNRSLEGADYTIIADINLDETSDVIIGGNNNTDLIAKIKYQNNSIFYSNETEQGTLWGSMGVADYDNDGDLDLIITGRADIEYVSKLYVNN